MTTQNSIKPSNDNISNPSQSQSTSSPITTPTMPTTPITTPIPKGLTIYSDLDFQGKSLFLPTGTYNKSFFDKNWTDLGIRSWKSTNTDKLMITFQGPGFDGGSVNVNAPNIGVIFSNNDFIMKGITDFRIFTPEQLKINYCLSQDPGAMWNSKWADPPSKCNNNSDVKKYTSLTGNWKTPNNSLGAFSITMNKIGNKGILKFDGSGMEYTFQLIDFDNKIWQSSGFGMHLKLIDDNKLRPITNPWNLTEEKMTYVKQ
jgi:hypothetical protein